MPRERSVMPDDYTVLLGEISGLLLASKASLHRLLNRVPFRHHLIVQQ
jgi:hypothetical protein